MLVTTGVLGARQPFMRDLHFRPALLFKKLDRDDALHVLPILIVLPLPGEDELCGRDDLAVFAADSHLAHPFVENVKAIFPADAQIDLRVEHLARRRTKPMLDLRGSRPRREDAIGRRFDETFYLEAGGWRAHGRLVVRLLVFGFVLGDSFDSPDSR